MTMDLFAYISLGLLAFLFLVLASVWLWELLREPLGRAVVVAVLLGLLLLCAGIGAVWLIGTKVI
ncbi:hypothetical protein [Streptomyces sp. Amel2xC10]|uniref:hypothetical protein n=1 Tax=Streptomyces sp. Amel2xC10 TaxID=1305826 RepID=UPI000A089AA0|nr:hypothetical protein [Streptomyces sp. Amel2xC10]SMF86400.1 hypothetical protein SAMN02745830_07165 [Streptomyces sp. Amel2xC10]